MIGEPTCPSKGEGCTLIFFILMSSIASHKRRLANFFEFEQPIRNSVFSSGLSLNSTTVDEDKNWQRCSITENTMWRKLFSTPTQGCWPGSHGAVVSQPAGHELHSCISAGLFELFAALCKETASTEAVAVGFEPL